MFRHILLVAPLVLLPAFKTAAQQGDSIDWRQIEATLDSLQQAQQIREAVTAYEAKMLRKEMSLNGLTLFPLVKGSYSIFSNEKFTETEALSPRYHTDATDYIPSSLPLVAAWTLKALGVESRSKTNRLLTANALSLGIAAATTYGLKHLVSERRPDGDDNRSFPSGHTALAFAGATLLDREFGHISPWISIGGYATATATQVLRLRHNAHYVHDVVTGAAIGVIATHLGYFLTDQVVGARGVNRPRLLRADVTRWARFLDQPTSLSLTSGVEFGSKKADSRLAPSGASLRLSSTLSTSVDYSCFWNSRWAVEASLRLSTANIHLLPADPAPPASWQQPPPGAGQASAPPSSVLGSTLNFCHATLALKYSLPISLSQRFSVKLLGGQRYQEPVLFSYPRLLPSYSLPSSWNWEYGAGVGLTFLSARSYAAGFGLDYIHTHSSLLPNRWYFSSSWRILL